ADPSRLPRLSIRHLLCDLDSTADVFIGYSWVDRKGKARKTHTDLWRDSFWGRVKPDPARAGADEQSQLPLAGLQPKECEHGVGIGTGQPFFLGHEPDSCKSSGRAGASQPPNLNTIVSISSAVSNVPPRGESTIVAAWARPSYQGSELE